MLHRERKIRAKMIQRHSELLHQLRQTRLLSRCSAVRGLTSEVCRDHFGEVLVSHGLPANKLLGPIIQALPASEWVGPGISIDASLLVGLVVASRNGRVLSVTEFSVTVRLEWGGGVPGQHDDDATSRGPLSHSSSSPRATRSLWLGPPKGNEHTRRTRFPRTYDANGLVRTGRSWCIPADHAHALASRRFPVRSEPSQPLPLSHGSL
jgi:hypothetical protein